MKLNFTENDIIRALFNETSILESSLIRTACKNDPKLNTLLQDFTFAKSQLDNIELEPPKFLEEEILNYSNNSTLST